MSLSSLILLTHPSSLKILKPPIPLHSPPAKMKDRPPSPYGAVYVPPHQRFRALIPTAASPPRAVDSKPVFSVNAQQSSIVSSGNACLPHHPRKKSSIDQLSSEGSDRDPELSVYSGASTFEDIDTWKCKLKALIRENDKQELISREKKDRRQYEDIAALASEMGLYSQLYAKVIVVSKAPLPNYRFDLDEKRPQREVALPPGLQRRSDYYLQEYISQKPKGVSGYVGSSGNDGIGTDEGLFEQPVNLAQSKAAMEKILWRRSLQMHAEQKTWQV